MNSTQFNFNLAVLRPHNWKKKKLKNAYNGEIGILGLLRHLMQSYDLIAKGICCAWDGESQASA